MVKIKRIYDPAVPEDDKRIYIHRLWPRGLKKTDTVFDEWVKEVSPSDALSGLLTIRQSGRSSKEDTGANWKAKRTFWKK